MTDYNWNEGLNELSLNGLELHSSVETFVKLKIEGVKMIPKDTLDVGVKISFLNDDILE